jgi:hypothetical protein
LKNKLFSGETQQTNADAKHIKALSQTVAPDSAQNPELLEHQYDISWHEKCALCVPHPFPDDLREVIDAWESVPEVVRAGILSMVKTVQQRG